MFQIGQGKWEEVFLGRGGQRHEGSQYGMLDNYNCSIATGRGNTQRTLDTRMAGGVMAQVMSTLGTTWMLHILSIKLG